LLLAAYSVRDVTNMISNMPCIFCTYHVVRVGVQQLQEFQFRLSLTSNGLGVLCLPLYFNFIDLMQFDI